MPPRRVGRACYVGGAWRVYIEVPILTVGGASTWAYLIGEFGSRGSAAEIAYHYREYGMACEAVEYAMVVYSSFQGSIDQEEVF